MARAKESSPGRRRAEALYGLLLGVVVDQPLPALSDLARLCGEFSTSRRRPAEDAHEALVLLRRDGRILWRSGTRSEARGHQAIRVVATRKVLKTAGCPFEAPTP